MTTGELERVRWGQPRPAELAPQAWHLHASGTSGRYWVPQLLRGRMAHQLVAVTGSLLATLDDSFEISMELTLPGAQSARTRSPAALTATFRGRAAGRHNVNRYLLRGELQAHAARGPIECRLRDHGWVDDPRHGRRRLLAITGTLDRRAWGCAARWSPASWLTATAMRFSLDTAWIPGEPPGGGSASGL